MTSVVKCRPKCVGNKTLSRDQKHADTLNEAMKDPEAMLESLDQEQVKKCSHLCGKTAEKVIEIISEAE